MQTYFMFGKYNAEAIKGISTERTKKAKAALEKAGGKVVSMYALLGRHDLAFIVNFPGTEDAMKASLSLTKLTGIMFATSPAVPVDDFDRMIS